MLRATIDHMKFEKPTSDFLRQMHWSEDRTIDTHSYLRRLSEDGYTLSPPVESFLECFGGLEGLMPAYVENTKLERIHFDPVEAIGNIYREKVATYEERVGEPLVAVGEAYNGHLTLMLSATGRMYGGYDDFLCLLGNSAAEAIVTLFERKGAKEIS
jgi:hypothetical protein